MFNLFNKKVRFLNIWSGTPDIHCHVLPGIDDGSKDAITSNLLLEKYKSLGCKRIIATPHTMGGIYDNTKTTIRNSFDKLLPPESIKITYSSEYMLDENFYNLLKNDEVIPITKKYILIEMSYFQPPENLFQIIYEISLKGYKPILAHPERYNFYSKNFDIYKKLKTSGCLLQLNALSLSNHYGKTVKHTAHKLLKNGLYDFIGTDTHHMEHLNKIEIMEIDAKYKNSLMKVCQRTSEIFL